MVLAPTGVERHSMAFVLYAPGSQAEGDVGQDIVCPNCLRENCPATASTAVCPSSNNPPSLAAGAQPPILNNPAGNAHQIAEEAVCGASCKAQTDCTCSDYLCLQDYSLIPRLRNNKQECTYIPLSSQNFPTLGAFGLGSKRDLGSTLDPEIAKRCVCDVDHVGPECCGSII